MKARLALIERDIKGLNSRESTPGSERNKYLSLMEKAEAEKQQLVEKLAEPPCFAMSNATSQALALRMKYNNNTMMSHASDARGVAAIMLGRHEKGNSQTDDEFYTQAYTVTDYCRIDRVSRAPVSLEKPCLEILWLLQGDLYRRLWLSQPLLEGGFLARVLTCVIETIPHLMSREWITFDPDIAKAYEATLTKLLTTYRMNTREPMVTPISPDAKTALFDYADRIVGLRQRGEFSEFEQPFVARWAENAWRMALVLHGATHADRAHFEEVACRQRAPL